MIADMVLPNERMADIGSDHALLPCFLVLEGRCPSAIVGELGDGPFQRARQGVERSGLAQRIDVRQGDGLAVLRPGEAASVVLAGMGGTTAVEILERAASKAASFRRLVVQVNNGLELVRAYAARNGWMIADEAVAWDDDYYVCMALEPAFGLPYTLNRLESLFGPVLLKRKNEPDVRAYFQYWIGKYREIAGNIPPDAGERAQAIRSDYLGLACDLEEVLA